MKCLLNRQWYAIYLKNDYGISITGQEQKLMMADFADFRALVSKTCIWNGDWALGPVQKCYCDQELDRQFVHRVFCTKSNVVLLVENGTCTKTF